MMVQFEPCLGGGDLRIVTLATCYNRRDHTLDSLSDLHQQQLADGVLLQHVIVDDGSSDGTADAVREQFPDVEIVKGNGQLYWAGGMRHGWAEAVAGRKFDYLFVYNDDVSLSPDAIADLLAASESVWQENPCHVIAGSFKSSDGGQTTYGGRLRSSSWHPLKFAGMVEPNGRVQRADTLNMNGALITAEALKKVGFLSDYFLHSGADFEFGLKLAKAGGAVYVAGQPIGECDANPELGGGPTVSAFTPLRQRLGLIFDNKREPFRQRLCYYRQHGGVLWPVLWVSPYVTVWIRYAWDVLLRLAGRIDRNEG